MKKNISHIGIGLCLIIGTGCNKFLDVKPKGYSLLTTATDYDEWLNSESLVDDPADNLIMMQDNVDNPYMVPASTTAGDLSYEWQPQFALDATASPVFWPTVYNQIYYFNTVINGVLVSSGGSQQQVNSLYAEALLGRAYEYLWLVNLYGKPYSASTATTDLGVPYVTSIDVSAPIPARSTVQQIYDHVITDLTQAIPNLPMSNAKDRFRGSVAAGYSVLARAYYYMGNYAAAEKNAQLALTADQSIQMVDYNTIASPTSLSNPAIAPDGIYVRNDLPQSLDGAIYPSISFLQSCSKNDLRLKLFYASITASTGTMVTMNYNFTSRGGTVFTSFAALGSATNNYLPNSGTSAAEMQLIIAESAARLNDLTTALQSLNTVRKCRIASSAYTAIQSSIQDTVIQKVLNERSYEFAFSGLRWLDMRKLDAEGLMPAVTHLNAAGTVIATLQPGSARYTLQIPTQIILYNPQMPQNP
jgi:hypothetical protein